MMAAFNFILVCACRMLGKLATAAAEAANRVEFLMKCRRETGDVMIGLCSW
jgi:hypothetical protein